MKISAFMRRTVASSAVVAVVLAAPVIAAVLKPDYSKSSVSATFRQMGVPIEAPFKKFTATIDYDSAKPEASKAAVDIDVNSFDLGDPEFNKEVLKKEWFNAAQHPRANFVSSSIKAAGPGKLDVAGKLTIKGKTADVQFPLAVRKEATGQVFEGTLPIKRLAFNIGEGEWKDTSMVADEVLIKFRIVTTQ